MKTINHSIIGLFVATTLLFVACDDGIPEPGTMEVPVTSVSLDESLKGGKLMEVGQTLDVALQVHVEPANATDLAELFYSSNVEVATVTPRGVVTAQKPGISMISIYVGGIETYFTVTVVDQIPIYITALNFSAASKKIVLDDPDLQMSGLLSIEPFDQNVGVAYTSSAPEVASVDAEGYLHAHKVGKTTITARPAAKEHAEDPDLSTSIEIQIVRITNEDCVRTDWTMSLSHPIYRDTNIGSSEQAAIDGNENTTLSMIRPGRKYGSGPDLSQQPDALIWFQIDRGDNPGSVNYFRIAHRPAGGNNQNILVRWFGFNRIEGSNDNVNFETLAERVAVTPNPSVYENLLTDRIAIPENNYRYLRFIGQNDPGTTMGFYCTPGNPNPGSTIQVNEFYLGLRTEITEE